MQEERGGPSRPTQSATEAGPPENRAESPLSRGVWAHRWRRCTGRSVRWQLRHLATPKRTEDVRSGVLLRLHWEKRDARSDECAMVAASMGHQPGSRRATRELGQRHLAFVAAPRLAGQLKGARRKGSGSRAFSRSHLGYHTILPYLVIMVWYGTIILYLAMTVWYGIVRLSSVRPLECCVCLLLRHALSLFRNSRDSTFPVSGS